MVLGSKAVFGEGNLILQLQAGYIPAVMCVLQPLHLTAALHCTSREKSHSLKAEVAKGSKDA